MDTAFLDTVSSLEETSWLAKIQLCGQKTWFKLDTGTEVTAISEHTLHGLGGQKLSPPKKVLYGPSRRPLQVIGQFKGKCVHGNNTTTQTMYVVSRLKTKLLGLPAITALNLATRVDATTEAPSVIQMYPTVFQGLGNLGEEYRIRIKPGEKPYALFTPRNIPLPLRPKVKQELDRMESIGVISKVDEPTEWCAGMVAVPKKSGAIRICVDLKPLNESVLREVHPCQKWTKHLRSCQEPRSSVNWMPIVDFGRFPWQNHPDYSLPSSPPMGAIASISCRLGYQVPRSTSRSA